MIKVIDSIMGSGKTSWAIQKMQKETGPFLYITPLLTEVERIVKECPEFVQPEKSKIQNKAEHLKELLAGRLNIAATHQLFRYIDKETIGLLKGYTLILDEVIEVIELLKIKSEKLKALFDREILKYGEGDSKTGQAILIGDEKRLDEFQIYQKDAELGRLILVCIFR